MPISDIYGHTHSEKAWEPLKVHLQEVSALAGDFASAFDAADWGRLAGYWHDLGKYSEEFQNYLKEVSEHDCHRAELRGSVDHSSAGAQWSIEKHKQLGMLLSHIIAGHHSGLLDYHAAGAACLEKRLKKVVNGWREHADPQLLELPMPPPPKLPQKSLTNNMLSFRLAFWVRMLFSALVDADFLATESYMRPEQTELRSGKQVGLSQMRHVLDSHIKTIQSTSMDTKINCNRNEILQQCLTAAKLPPGFFELCVPTGGGKTISSLAFAFKHAEANNLRRVVMAVPFTSIIEQNAQVYRNIFDGELGAGAVLEHHSNLDPQHETNLNRLQAENWDAPLVVTTNVQMFESLFACQTSRCRKIHRLAKSVIVLDEVQAIPVELLKPTLWAMRELVECYGCSIVLCSATQPALHKRDGFEDGLEKIEPIIQHPEHLYREMRRTTVTVKEKLDQGSLSKQLLAREQVLCVLNTKRSVASLFELIGLDEGHFHLSTRMCAAHRLKTLDQIRKHLQRNEPCRVISTQLVEAGVDLDFPTVFRARCGLDSLAQAAGRCNREGKLETGEVVFFSSEELPPKGFLRHTAQLANELLGKYDDLLSPECISDYFRLLYCQQSDRLDKRKVLEQFGDRPNTLHFQFREACQRYKFIEEEGQGLLIPWKDSGKELLCEFMQSRFPDRQLCRQLQRYTVQVHDYELALLREAGACENIHERWFLTDGNRYDEKEGLLFGKEMSAEDLVI